MAYEGDIFVEDVSFDSYGGTQSLGVSVDFEDAGSGWSYENNVGSWISISFDSWYSPSTMLRITASPNTTSSERGGIINITFNGVIVGEINVNQDAGTGGGGNTGNTGTTVVRETSVGSTSLSVGGGSGSSASTSLKANYNCNWTLDIPAINWIDGYISNNGTSAATLYVNTTESNPTTNPRTVTIEVIDEDGEVYEISVTQAGGSATSSVSPTTIEQGYSSGTHYVSLSSNFSTSWSVSSNSASWCSATITKSSSSSSSDGELKIVVSSNPNAEDRSATIVVSNSNRSHNITVYQDAAPQTYDISKSSASFTSNGGSTTASLTSNGVAKYNEYSSPSWCSVSFSNNGGKNVTLNVSVNPNTSVDSRDGYVTVTPDGGNTVLSLYVSQTGLDKETNISTTDVTIGSGSSKSITVSLTANYNCKWGEPYSNVSWLSASVSNTSNYNETLTISTTSFNDDTNPRSGRITISDDIGNEYSINVTQVAGEANSSVSPQIHYVGNSAGNYSSTLTSNWNANWSVTSKPSWCTTTITGNNSYNANLNIGVSANPKAAERVGTILLGNGTHSFSVQVQQEPANWSYDITTSSLSFAYNGESKNTTLTANGDATWKVYGTKPSWISSVSFTNNGSENVTCTITAAANTTVSGRSDVVKVTPNNGANVFSITVSQTGKPKQTDVSTTAVTIGSTNGSTGSVSLTANYGCDWSFNETVSWLSASLSGDKTENATLNIITTQSNPSATTRTGNITVSDDNGNEWKIQVTQNASSKSSSVNMSSHDIVKGGGTLTGTLISNWVTSWSITQNGSWATASLSNNVNTQNGTITITAGKNPNASERTDRIIVKNDNRSFNIDIRQDAGDWVYSVSPTSLSFGVSAATKSVTLTANGDANYTTYSKPSWVSVSYDKNGSESVTGSITTSANDTVSGRSGTVVFTPDNGTTKLNVSVSQIGLDKETSVSTTAVTIGSGSSATASVSLTANYNCDWSVSNTINWFDVSLSGDKTKNAKLTITTTQANPKNYTRSGKFEVFDDNGNEWEIQVTQTAAGKSSSISPATIETTYTGGTYDVTLTANWVANWSVKSNSGSAWISTNITSNSTENGKIRIVIGKQSKAEERQATIVLQNDNRTHNITVTQGPAPYTYSVNPTSLSFAYNGETKTSTLTANGYANWKVYNSNKPDWCDITFTNNGSESVTCNVKALANTIVSSRSGVVKVTPDNTNVYDITVSQTGIPKETSVSTTAVTIGSGSSATASVSLTANYNCKWNSDSTVSWLSVKVTSNETKNATLVITTTQANPNAYTRMGKINVNDDNGNEWTIQVTQTAAGKSSSVNMSSYDIVKGGGTLTGTLISNWVTSWSITQNGSWATASLSNNTSTQNGTITITAGKNPNASERTDRIIVKNDDRSFNIDIRQNAGDWVYSVSPTSLSFGVSGATKSVTLTANGDASYTTYSKPSWVSVLYDGNGSESVIGKITTTTNDTYEDRNGIVVFTPDNGTTKLNVTILQSSINKETYEPVNSVTIGSANTSSVTVLLTANYNAKWEFDSPNTWLNGSFIDNQSKSTTLIIKATQANPDNAVRTGKVYVSDDIGNEYTINVIQEKGAKSSSISPSMIEPTYTGGTYNVVLTANWLANWSVESNSGSAWISTNITSNGTKNGNLEIVVSSNPDAEERQATIVLKNDNRRHNITVTQGPAPQTYKVSPTSLSFTYNGESKSVALTSNGYANYKVFSNPEWCSVNFENNGSKNVTGNITASANTTVSSRSGTVVFTPDNGTTKLNVSVSQAGIPKETSVSTTAVTIGSGSSATASVSLTANYNCDWSFNSTVSWLDLSISNDKTKNATLNIITNQVNPSGINERKGNIIVSNDNDDEWVITVTQEKAALSSNVSPQVLYYGKEGGSKTCTLSANFNAYWYIISKPDYATANIPTNGTTGGSITIKVGVNPTVEVRDDNDVDQVIIGSKYDVNGSYIDTFSIKIKQDAGDAYYNVSPTNIEHDFQAFTENVNLETNDNGIWSVISNNDWINANINSPNNKITSITLNVSQNNNNETREGSVSVLFNDKIVATVNVSQTKFVIIDKTVYMTGDNKLATRKEFNEQMKLNHFTTNLGKTILIDEINGISWNEDNFKWTIRIDNEELYIDENKRCIICRNIYKYGTNEE